MPEISTLVDDIYKLFDPSIEHTINEDNLNEFAENIKQVMRNGLAARDETKGALRFSSLGKPDRQIWYDNQGGASETLTPKTYLKFLYGHVIEAMVMCLVKESGHHVEDEQLEVECLGVKGHLDCVIDGVTVDVKSAAPYSYVKFVNQTFYEDIFSRQYLDQLCGYSNIRTPGTAPAFLVFNKVAGDLCLTTVSQSIAEDYKPENRIAHLKEVLDSPLIPPRCYEDEPDGKSGNRKLGLGCSYCKHKFKCWPGLRMFIYSNGPRYLTQVVKTPDVYEVVGETVEDNPENI